MPITGAGKYPPIYYCNGDEINFPLLSVVYCTSTNYALVVRRRLRLRRAKSKALPCKMNYRTVRINGIFSIGSIVIGISSGQDFPAKARALEYK